MNLKLDLSCFNWVKFVMQDKGLPPPSRHLALYLSTYMNLHQDIAWPSISRTEEDTGYTRPTVIKHYAILEESGWLVKDKNRPRGGTTYIISFPQRVERLVKEINQSETTSKGALPVTSKGALPELVKEINPNNNRSNNTNNKEKREAPSEKKESKKKQIDWSSIEGLNLEAWNELMEYRRETRLPRYKTKRKAEELAQLPYEKQRECVRYTIDNEYKGLFPERYRAKASDDRTNWPSIEEMAKHGHDPEYQRKWGFIQ